MRDAPRSLHAECRYPAAPVLERTVLQQPARRRPGRNAATIHLAVVAAASLPARRNNAASYRTRAVVRFDAGNITVLEDQPYSCQAGRALGRHFDNGRVNLAPGQLRVVQ